MVCARVHPSCGPTGVMRRGGPVAQRRLATSSTRTPWYQNGEDDRIWIAYVDAARTLQGFETFLDQYRALLASMPSGVTYVAPTVWHGVIQSAFTKALEPRDGGIMSRFHDYCQFRCIIEGARSNAPLTLDERRQYRERCAEFLTPTFDALYKQFMQTSSISSTDVDAAAFPPCLLRVHALGRRYDPECTDRETGSTPAPTCDHRDRNQVRHACGTLSAFGPDSNLPARRNHRQAAHSDDHRK